MKSVWSLLFAALTAVPSYAAPLVRVELPIRSAPASPIVLPAVLPYPFSSPSPSLSVNDAPPSLAAPSAPAAVHLRAAVAAAPALKAAPARRAAADGPAAAPPSPAAPEPVPAGPEIVTLTMPSGKLISVARGVMDERGALQIFGGGPHGLLLDLGPSETSFGIRSGALVKMKADWALFSHDGRLTRLQEARGGNALVGGPARSVLVLPAGRARELGLAPGAVVRSLGDGSTVLDVRDALMSGEWQPFDFAEAMKENPASEPRHMLDALTASFDELVMLGGPRAPRAAELRWETLKAVAKHPRTDAYLRMQAATRMYLDGMPRALFRLNKDLPHKLQITYQFVDTWIHETGHQLVAGLVGSPLMEKRVFAHGAGFITTPVGSAPRQLAIDAAGGAAEVAVGGSSAALGAWALSGLHGWALAAAALPALALLLVGAHMAYSSVAHAAKDLAHMFTLLGWPRAAAFVDEVIAESTREVAALRAPGMTVPVSVFYRVAFRLLALKLYFRG